MLVSILSPYQSNANLVEVMKLTDWHNHSRHRHLGQAQRPLRTQINMHYGPAHLCCLLGRLRRRADYGSAVSARIPLPIAFLVLRTDHLRSAVCRAFQGIGGSGIYAVNMAMLYELVPPARYSLYTAMVTVVIALAFSLGPVLGGLIAGGSWRWVFLLKYVSIAGRKGVATC